MQQFLIKCLNYFNILSLRFVEFLKEKQPFRRKLYLFAYLFFISGVVVFSFSGLGGQNINLQSTGKNQYLAVKNSSVEVAYTDLKFNPKTQTMLINIKAKNTGQQLLGNDLNFKIKTHSAMSASVETIPTFDNQWLLLVKGVPKDFKSMGIEVTSNLPADKTINSDHEFEMMVIGDHQAQIDRNLEPQNRDYFAGQAVEREIKHQQKEITKHEKTIKTTQQMISHNKKQISTMDGGEKYLTSDEQTENNQSVETLKSQNSTYNDQIANEKINISGIEQKIKKLKLKLRDIRNGDFKYPKTSKTKKANKVQLINQSKGNQ